MVSASWAIGLVKTQLDIKLERTWPQLGLLCIGLVLTSRFYSALQCERRNARIASAVLAIAIPSIYLSVRPSVHLSVRLSVTRRYCVKTTARCTVQFALS